MHFSTYNTELIVSFIFYSLLIALFQIIIFKIKKKRKVRELKNDK